MEDVRRHIFVTGGTGYVGRRLISELIHRQHCVRSVVRAGSHGKLPLTCEAVVGDPLDGRTFERAVPPTDTFVHLVGVPRPAPWKGRLFRTIDLPSVHASLAAAQASNVRHFIYVSVAQPAPVMKAYIEVRAECEALIRVSGLAATIVRPWYILGPGHYWPFVLKPFYAVLKRIPATREAAERLGLVTIDQMVSAVVWAVEHPVDAPQNVRVIDVPTIGALALR